MCLIDKDLLPFRTSVLAVASLETCLDRLAQASTGLPNFTTDAQRTTMSIENRVYEVISAENKDTDGADIGIILKQFKTQVNMVKERLNAHFNNRRDPLHKLLMMYQPDIIQLLYEEMVGNKLNCSYSEIEMEYF